MKRIESHGDPDRRDGAGPPPAWHALSLEETLSQLHGDSARGLTEAEVRQRQRRHGPNTLPEPVRATVWRLVGRQFESPLIYLLALAAVVALAVGDPGDAAIIAGVVVVNAIVGALQEGRAERSMRALRRLSRLKSRVVRDGVEKEVEASDLVPGDLLQLTAGDAVGADARLIQGTAMSAAEALLTGESLPVAKAPEPLSLETPLPERMNLLFAGTHVVSGTGRALVVATGGASEVGRIARLTTGGESAPTPLESRVRKLGRTLTLGAGILFAAVLAVGVVRGLPFREVFLVAITQTVSMVPEGLPVAMTIALAVGMQRMARQGTVVRRLSAVETLGSTTVICSDKTGTLTRNEMTVGALWLPGDREIRVTGEGYSPEGRLIEGGKPIAAGADSGLRMLLEAAVLCNDAQLLPPEPGGACWRPLGDPTEAALLTVAMKGGMDPARIRAEWPRRGELPFDPSLKLMATEHQGGSEFRVVVKGAPEAVLPLCGGTGSAGAAERAQAETAATRMGTHALRAIAVAVFPGSSSGLAHGFKGLQGPGVLLGIAGQVDPPRAEVPDAVRACRSAGVRVVMVTGDHPSTALAIARQVGIAGTEDPVVTGVALDSMGDAVLADAVGKAGVFARVRPEQKLQIVRAFQSQGHVVAVTGDGVNDAPALSKADVGVAMGMSGTEVAKEAAHVVLGDDNFATLVRAVEQGRLVRRNLRKVLVFLFATSLDEVLVLMGALLLGHPLPLAAVQILWINIVTESTLTVNLVMEGLEGHEMREPPAPRDEPLIPPSQLGRLAMLVVLSTAVTLGFFVHRMGTGVPLDQVRTETFTLLAFCQWFNVLNCRSETRSAFGFSLLRNRWLLAGLGLSVVLQAAVIYVPALGVAFHTTPLPGRVLLGLFAMASAVLWAEELRKGIARSWPGASRWAIRRLGLTAHSGALSRELGALATRYAEAPVTFGELLEATRGKGISLLLVLVALPFLTPVPLPGFSIPFGVVVAIAGGRMALGLGPWLPRRLASVRLPSRFLTGVLKVAGRVLEVLELLLKPRLEIFHDREGFRRAAGVLIALCGVLLVLPLPLPFSNSLPALTILLLSAGALERDGLFFLAGCAAFAVTAAFFVLLAAGGAEAVHTLLKLAPGF